MQTTIEDRLGLSRSKYSLDEAWDAICDEFPTGRVFTSREAVSAIWPTVERKNHHHHCSRLNLALALIERESDEHWGDKQVQRVRDHRLAQHVRWMLPGGPLTHEDFADGDGA